MRAAGATVQCTHTLGKGVPDICWSKNGQSGWMEIKDGSKPWYERRLTKAELEWRFHWQGRYDIILSAEDAIKVLQEIP